MFNAARRHINPATVIAVVALVFAMSGGAYALTGSSGGSGGGNGHSAVAQIAKKKTKTRSKSTGKPGPRGPEGKQGPEGKPGAEGKEGKQGPEGKEGKAGVGSEGKPGTPGVGASAKSFTGAKIVGSEECENGGLEVTSASGTSLVCNGANGTTGYTSTLPEGEMETGAWVVSGLPHAQISGLTGAGGATAISYDIPLAEAATPPDTGTALQGYQEVIGEGEGEGEGKEAPAIKRGECKGNADKPEAAPGRLCVFIKFQLNVHHVEVSGEPAWEVRIGTSISGKYGAEIGVQAENSSEVVLAEGTWAVTEKIG